jgi:hypothetical protein
MGGGNKAPQPVDMLIAALIGCKQATAKFVARSMKIDLQEVEFELWAERYLKFGWETCANRGNYTCRNPHALFLPLINHFSRDENGAISMPITEVPSIPSRLTRIRGKALAKTNATPEQLQMLAKQVK